MRNRDIKRLKQYVLLPKSEKVSRYLAVSPFIDKKEARLFREAVVTATSRHSDSTAIASHSDKPALVRLAKIKLAK